MAQAKIDYISILESLDIDQIRERLTQMEWERSALLVLLRSLVRLNRQKKSVGTKKKKVIKDASQQTPED